MSIFIPELIYNISNELEIESYILFSKTNKYINLHLNLNKNYYTIIVYKQNYINFRYHYLNITKYFSLLKICIKINTKIINNILIYYKNYNNIYKYFFLLKYIESFKSLQDYKHFITLIPQYIHFIKYLLKNKEYILILLFNIYNKKNNEIYIECDSINIYKYYKKLELLYHILQYHYNL